MKNFIIVGTQRTGSSPLGAAIGLHPQVACGWEWTQRVSPLSKIGVARRGFAGNFSCLDKKNQEHMEEICNSSTRLIGFRRLFRSSAYWSLHPKFSPALWHDRLDGHIAWLKKNPSVQVVHIVRNDNIAWLRSKFAAKESGKYFGAPYPSQLHFEVKVDEALKRLQSKRWVDKCLYQLRDTNSYMQVLYEDFAADNFKVAGEVLSFLDCDPLLLPETGLSLQRQSTVSVEESIENYDKLMDALRRHQLLEGLCGF